MNIQEQLSVVTGQQVSALHPDPVKFGYLEYDSQVMVHLLAHLGNPLSMIVFDSY